MRKNTLTLITGLIALSLLVVLAIQLIKAPTFMLPSVYLTTMLIAALLIGSLIIVGIIKIFYKKGAFFLMLYSVISVASIFFIYRLYSPTLTIIVQKGYTGKITLVLSNVKEDILRVDSNGIGYITQRTFDRTYTAPIVFETDGTNVTNQAVGFNPSTFWAKSSFSIAVEGNNTADEIEFLSFEIAPKNKQRQEQYDRVDLSEAVDKSKLYKNK